MAEAPQKRSIVFPIPTAEEATPAAIRAARATQVVAPKTEVPSGVMMPGEVYRVSEKFAQYCVAQKGARYVGADGKPTAEAEAAAPITTNDRPGQEGWKGWAARNGMAEEFGEVGSDTAEATVDTTAAPVAPEAKTAASAPDAPHKAKPAKDDRAK